ncbi:P-loop containing nucleoside triphosphate hydrolase protein [Dissoconium aciculare CBS 342.82]|jgi:nicotinamide/nicotinate riboside kinase|uniref:P-loop containing nucleoside triphosphate hydrolase protein n=1 Tax=Dissoconium aciculare CBS 342.82 TaxID=1314786 RepID=A0A6J3LZ36_9PEZI|nr:P-loop containing nucleoside triphosphate hydrolase protein [Dissoconium aciculare CBS 342.82]KAF1821021.1 P-loop containing nucleoside triphosphate hydrolase protein [Dissoconium aciculare CBS 342.82]
MADNNVLLVGLSGVSSSGKTTIARLLRDIFPRTFVLHEDDFYKPDTEIPVKAGVADWDCLESINIPALEEALAYIRQHGTSPPDLDSKEDKNSVGEVKVDQTVIDDLRWSASRWMYADAPPIAIIDGFLLYSEGMKSVRDAFDVKMFLRADHSTCKARREARSGYVTLEGFWKDPPGYVDQIVWPNYVADHAFLFREGNVEGKYNDQMLHDLQIEAVPSDAASDLTACVQWAFNVVSEALDVRTRRSSR